MPFAGDLVLVTHTVGWWAVPIEEVIWQPVSVCVSDCLSVSLLAK